MSYNALLQAAILRCETSKRPAGVSADAFLITTFNHMMYTNVVPRESNTAFDKVIKDGITPLRGQMLQASKVYELVTGEACDSSNAKLTGNALKRLGCHSVRHGGKILWIL
jgi:hypothetical protein